MCGFDSGPILAGATARIDYQSDALKLPVFAFASSDPSVFEIASSGSGFVRVAAHQPGSAMLTVTTADGQPSRRGRAVHRERRVARVSGIFTPIFLAGSPESLPVLARTALGTPMFGRGAIQLSGSGLARHTDYDPAADQLFAGTDHFVLSGTALGPVTVTASLGAVTASVPLTIVDTSAVAKISVTTLGNNAFRAETAAGLPVRGAHCVPSASAAFPVMISGDQLEGVVPVPVLPRRFLVSVNAIDPNEHGVATVSCAIGGVVGSFDVTL